MGYYSNVGIALSKKGVDTLKKVMTDKALDTEDYYYVRIGEDHEDNEVQGCYWDNPFCMDLVRRINYEEPQAA